MVRYILLLGLFFLCTTCVVAQGNWKRVHGNGITPAPSAMGTYAPGNSPLGRYASASMQDNAGTFWLYSGNGANDLWRFNPSIEQWMHVHGSLTVGQPAVYGTQGVAAPVNHPESATFGHPSWGDLAGNLWIYGPNGLNDLWKFDIATGMWTWMKGTASLSPASFGTQGVPAATNNPGTCNETDCHWTDSNGNLWLYTEFDGNLWKFDVTTNMWIWMKGGGAANANPVYGTMNVFAPNNTPGGFVACPAVGTLYTMWMTSDDHLWMLVNRDGGNIQSEMWEYDPLTNQWRCRRIDVHPFGQSQVFPTPCVENNPAVFPVVRSEMRVDWVDDCNNLYFFGGSTFCTNSTIYNDIWRYNPSNNCYTYIRGGTTPEVPGVQGVFAPANTPPVAAGGQSWQNENGFYLMGGQGALQNSNAVWLYAPDSVQGNFTATVNCFTANFTNQSTTGCNYIKETLWDFGDGTTSSLDNPTHVYAMNGDYQVTMIVKNCSWDADTVVQTVTIDCGFSISLPSDTICVGECAELIVNSSENTDSLTFAWDNGIVINNDSVTVCPLITTSFTVIATNPAGDSDTVTAVVTVMNPPQVDLGVDTVLCGGTLLLNAGNAPALYQWQDNSSNQQLLVSSSGTYSVTVDNGGCTDSDTIQVIINGPLVNLGPDTTVCIPQFMLDAGNPGATYVWQDGSVNQTFQVSAIGTYFVTVTDANGCQIMDTIHVLPGALQVDLGPDVVLCIGEAQLLNAGNPGAVYNWSNGAITQSITVQEAGSYFVNVTQGVCEGSDTVNLVISDPLAVFSVSDTIGCAPLAVTFTDLSTSSSAINGWSWSFGDGTFSSAQHPAHNYSQSGNYNVQLSISTVDGCVSDTSKLVVVTVIPQPVASFLFSPQIPELETEIAFIDQSVNATSWSWNFGDGAEAFIQNPTHTYTYIENFEVTLVVTNEMCTDTTVAFIVIEEGLLFYVPNAFTPDDDEFNQVFKPVITSGVDLTSYHLTIYDRWGEVVFESLNTEIGWDGSYARCGLVQDGSYTWKIEFNGKRNGKAYVYHGHVNVLK
ncbi:MAG: hypothetical protein CHH17_11245 [Candidatus Fluviicola riflensis]|nr:MAG: hypothetical protein CHH17_11245 [Candidatus Fluviicola riflensis]